MNLLGIFFVGSCCCLFIAICGITYQLYQEDKIQRKRNEESIKREEQRRKRKIAEINSYLNKINNEYNGLN